MVYLLFSILNKILEVLFIQPDDYNFYSVSKRHHQRTPFFPLYIQTLVISMKWNHICMRRWIIRKKDHLSFKKKIISCTNGTFGRRKKKKKTSLDFYFQILPRVFHQLTDTQRFKKNLDLMLSWLWIIISLLIKRVLAIE